MRNLMIVICLVFIMQISATIINVPDDQPTIQAGIDVSVNTDTVLVQPGTYVENINFNGKAITVGSLFLISQDTTFILQTVVNGNENGSVVIFENGENNTSTLTGFTISNGNSGGIICDNNSSPNLEYLAITNNSANRGGGVYCWSNSNPVLENVTISNNTASLEGGGIYCATDSNPILENVTIENNSANVFGGGIYTDTDIFISNCQIINNSCNDGAELGRGGAIFAVSSIVNLYKCNFVNNSANSHAGAIYLSYAAANIDRCSFIGNTSGGNVGGIYFYRSSHLDITNCTFYNNSGSDSGAMRFYIVTPSIDIPFILNTISWNNSPNEILCSADGYENDLIIGYSDLEGGLDEIVTNNNANIIWLEGNINTDPLFVDVNSENYNLMQNSQCIDSGIALFEYEGEILIDLSEDEYFGIFPDMGAFEFELNANFEANETEVSIGQEIQFTDLSNINPITWQWDFENDGIIDSNEQNPIFSYTEAGIYSVSLTISNGTNTLIETKVDYINVSLTGTEIEMVSIATELIGNNPNPFNPETKIQFSISENHQTSLIIYNIKGQYIKTLIDDNLQSGYYNINWNGKDNMNKSVSSGVYLYELKVNNNTIGLKKCLLLK